ncbi:MAG: outer membrane beta-barrel family protein [Saprospiraceae bacterium]|nr:outer membrane beta-barrel family protein [Saprospiraceae bacterium]
MKHLLSLVVIALYACSIFAQGPSPSSYPPSDNKKIKGKIIDGSSGQPLEFATVSIYQTADSTLLSGGITEMNGGFEFNIDTDGSVYAVIEFIGYETTKVNNITFSDGEFLYDLGSIQISPGGIALDEVEVIAERSDMQFSLDKRIFNVGKDLASRGGSASDVLDNIPSISVGVEGDVNLRGSGNVRILINGRPSGLVGLNGTDGLRTIQANMIERVEVITNPSAKFEAEGMAGIINIILRKDRAKGFNGSFEVNGGFPERYGAGANLNYRQDKFNFFVNYNYQKRTGISSGNRYQEFYFEDTTFISLQEQRRDRSGNNHSLRFGSDYLLSDKEVITGAFLYRYGNDNNSNRVTYRDAIGGPGVQLQRLTEDDIPNYILRQDDELEEEPTLEYSINYDKKFDRKGQTLKADISFQSNTETESSFFNEGFYEGATLAIPDILSQRSANEEGQKQWRAQVDYEQPFDNKIKLESGLLGTFREIKNDFLVETLNDGIWESEEGLSNNFIYNENVLGAYSNIGKDFTSFSFQIGLRAEYSEIKTELLQTSEINDRSYTNLFPSGFLNYKLGSNNSLQASYSRRIRRPRFWDLNPFFTFTDRRNFFSGNPDLNPEFTDSYEFGHLKYWEAGNIGTSIYYRHTKDKINRIQTQDIETQTTIRRPENLGTQDNIGLEFIFAYTGIKGVRIDGALNGFRFINKGITSDGQDLSVDNYAWTSNLNAKVSFWKNGDIQMRLNYRAPRETLQGRRRSITGLNLAFSKDVTPDLTITMSVSDLFNNRRRQSIFEGENFFEESDFQWRPRTFTTTINYRINKKKDRRRKRQYNGGGEGGDF